MLLILPLICVWRFSVVISITGISEIRLWWCMAIGMTDILDAVQWRHLKDSQCLRGRICILQLMKGENPCHWAHFKEIVSIPGEGLCLALSGRVGSSLSFSTWRQRHIQLLVHCHSFSVYWWTDSAQNFSHGCEHIETEI